MGFVGKLRRKFKSTSSSVNAGQFTYGHVAAKVFKASKSAPLNIGAFCSIADDVTFLCDANHSLDAVTTFPVHRVLLNENLHHHRRKGISVGSDVWIGFSAIILPGITISDGAIIGAGSVVTKNVGPFEIVAGNPAVLIRRRFSDAQIAALMRIRWWDWDATKVKAEANRLAGPIDDFIAIHDIPADAK